MKLLILGAGASVGHSDRVPCPPVTKDLLPVLAGSHLTWGEPVIEQLAHKHSGNVEAIMDELLGAPQRMGNTYVLNQQLGRFFTQFAPDEDSLYVKLLHNIDPAGVVICSLNYDIILQRAAVLTKRQLYITGFEFCDFHPVERNERPDAIELLLPHGSGGLVETESVVQGNVFNSLPLDIRIRNAAGPKMCAYGADIEHYYRKNQLNPIMSYIHVGKQVTLGDKNLGVVQRRFEELCLSCDGIAIVGMQLNMKDKHILRPLMNSAAPIMLSVGKDVGFYRSFGSRLIDTGKYWSGSSDSILEFLTKH